MPLLWRWPWHTSQTGLLPQSWPILSPTLLWIEDIINIKESQQLVSLETECTPSGHFSGPISQSVTEGASSPSSLAPRTVSALERLWVRWSSRCFLSLTHANKSLWQSKVDFLDSVMQAVAALPPEIQTPWLGSFSPAMGLCRNRSSHTHNYSEWL